MTFLSPAFMFVFLPISLVIYALIPKYLKSYALPLMGISFFAAINLKNVFAIAAVSSVVIAIMISVTLYKKFRIRWAINACRIICIFSIFVVLALRFAFRTDFSYGVGVILCLMAGASLCADVLFANGRIPDTVWDVVVYITFFPVLLAGPFISYGDFVEKIDRIEFGVDNFSSGAIRFLIGILKCVAISEVLGEVYDNIFTSLGGDMSFLMMLVLASIYGVRIYYLFSGCSDMGRGLASMLGIRIEKDFGSSFKNATPCDYIRHFFSGLLSFCRSYIVKPITEIFKGNFGKVLATFFISLLYSLMFARTPETVYMLIIPIFAAMLFIVFRTGKKRKRVHIVPRILGYVGTFLLMSFFWFVIRIGGIDELIMYFDHVVNNDMFYITAYTKAVLRDSKYILLPTLTAIGIWLISKLFKNTDNYLDKKQKYLPSAEKDKTVFTSPEETKMIICLKYVSAVFLLFMFCFTVILLLPQYPGLSVSIFGFPFV